MGFLELLKCVYDKSGWFPCYSCQLLFIKLKKINLFTIFTWISQLTGDIDYLTGARYAFLHLIHHLMKKTCCKNYFTWLRGVCADFNTLKFVLTTEIDEVVQTWHFSHLHSLNFEEKGGQLKNFLKVELLGNVTVAPLNNKVNFDL